jgi:alkylation response protein AidB-like acyl-CoA dehydrogenase
MEFEFTEQQLMIKTVAKEFAEQEIAKSAVERDKKAEFPTEIIKKLGEMGFMGVKVSPEYGGAGLDTISYVLLLIEISKVDASVGVILSVINSLVTYVLEEYGSDFIKNKYLRDIASGEKLGAFALSEPEAGSDATKQKTFAKKIGDNWVLNGTKNWITNGTTADYYIVFAQTNMALKHKGISAFVVEKGTKGFEQGAKEDKMGIKSSDTCSLLFDNCIIPKENLIGVEGEGFKYAMSALNGGRIGIAAQAVGIAEASFEAALKYSKTRKAFGTEIMNHQAIQFKLAEMAANIEAAKLLTFKAAYLKDSGKNYAMASAMAKLKASKAAVDCALEAVQIHGGYGYVREYLVERYLRDAKVTEIYEGTSEIQKIIIFRELLKL